MSKIPPIAAAVLSLFLGTLAHGAEPTLPQLQADFKETVQPFVQTYCISCHSGAKPKGQVDLSAYPTLESVSKGLKQWEIVLEQLSAGNMPPDEAKVQPTPEARKKVIEW